jgi:hypothetical protein
MPALAISEAYRAANARWADDRSSAVISDAGPVVDAGRRYARLTVTPPRGQTFRAWFDDSTHLLARVTQKIGAATTTTFFSNYRNVGGCHYAGTMTIDGGDGEQYRQTFTLIRTKSSRPVPRRYFSLPKTDPKDSAFGASGSSSVPFWLEGNHVLFDARINAKGPITIILDTGGQTVVGAVERFDGLVQIGKRDHERHGSTVQLGYANQLVEHDGFELDADIVDLGFRKRDKAPIVRPGIVEDGQYERRLFLEPGFVHQTQRLL